MARRWWALLPLSLFFASCCSMRPSADFQSGDAEAAIRRMDADFSAAASSGNVDGLMSTYDVDAVLMPPNQPAARGTAAIRQYWSGLLGLGKIQATVTADNVIQSGDLATEAGRYDLTITPSAGGAPIRDNGKYVLVWRKRQGQWKAVYDVFNSDLAK
jgi:ketosteroid isomerase-like protein